MCVCMLVGIWHVCSMRQTCTLISDCGGCMGTRPYPCERSLLFGPINKVPVFSFRPIILLLTVSGFFCLLPLSRSPCTYAV